MVAKGDEGGEQLEEDGGFGNVDPFPDPVGYAVRARGRRGGAFAQGLFYLLRGKGGCIRVRVESSPGRGRRFGWEEVLEECVVYGGWGVGPWE